MKQFLVLSCAVLSLILLTSGCIGERATLANWPSGYKSAVVIAFEVEQAQSKDLSKAVEILNRHDANATFFVVAGYYDGASGLLKHIKNFEVASKGWNQSEWSGERVDQRVSIERADTWLKEQGYNPVGFRAPFLKRNEKTLKILSELGYSYDSSSSLGLLPSRQNTLLELPLSIGYDPFWNKEVKTYLPLFYYVFENTYERDGLFTFYTYPEHIDERMEVFLDYISTKDVWLASGNEVVEWWEKKEQVSIETEGDFVFITNNGRTKISGLMLKSKEDYIDIPAIEPGETINVEF